MYPVLLKTLHAQHGLDPPSKSFGAMTVISEMVHPRGLNFANQRKAVILRDLGHSFADIAAKVRNLKGKATSKYTVQRLCAGFSKKDGYKKYGYEKERPQALQGHGGRAQAPGEAVGEDAPRRPCRRR